MRSVREKAIEALRLVGANDGIVPMILAYDRLQRAGSLSAREARIRFNEMMDKIDEAAAILESSPTEEQIRADERAKTEARVVSEIAAWLRRESPGNGDRLAQEIERGEWRRKT